MSGPRSGWTFEVRLEDLIEARKNLARLIKDSRGRSLGTHAALLELAVEQGCVAFALGVRWKIDNSQFGRLIRQVGFDQAIKLYSSKAKLVFDTNLYKFSMRIAPAVDDDALDSIQTHGGSLLFLEHYCEYVENVLSPALELAAKIPERFPPTMRGRYLHRLISDPAFRARYLRQMKEYAGRIRQLDIQELDEVKKAGFYLKRDSATGRWSTRPISRETIGTLRDAARILLISIDNDISEARDYIRFRPSPLVSPLDWPPR